MSESMSNFILIPTKKEFNLTVGYFFTLNVVVGAGFLNLPNIFNSAGWLFCWIYMFYAACQSFYLSLIVIETMSRVDAIEELREQGVSIKRLSLREILFAKPTTDIHSNVKPCISDRRIDVCFMSKSLMTPWLTYFYYLSLFLTLGGAMTIYATIFPSSMADTVPLGFLDSCNIYDAGYFGDTCYFNYWIFLAIFGGLMIFLVVIGLKEQKWIQASLSILRFVTIFLILIISITLLGQQTKVDSDEHHDASMPSVISVSKLGVAISSILFAFSYQPQFPSIAEFVQDREVNLKKIAFMVTATCFMLYSALGMIVPVAISDVDSLVTLNFDNYSGGYSKDDRPWWTYIIAYFLVIFPAADVFSSFPLIGVSVADNMTSLIYGATNSESVPKNKLRWIRFAACVLPLAIAFFVYNLGAIMTWVGIFAFFSVPIFIPLMHIASRKLLPQPGVFDVSYASTVSFI